MSLVDYLHRAHLAYVVVTLRKLYDDKRKGSRAVNSLRSVIKHIVDNQHLFNREHFVTYDGLPYEAKDSADWKTNYTVEWRHHFFDQLSSRSNNEKRKPTDRLDTSVCAKIYDGIVLRPEIETFANKFLAHSVAKKNRPDEQPAFSGITLTRIRLQCKNVIWASQQIGRYLCEPILTEVPTPQFDILEQWENGLLNQTIKRQLLTYWYQRMEWWSKWTRYYWNYHRLYFHP